MTATLVTLIDGQVVASDAEAWRDECLARYALGLGAERQAWFAEFELRHGQAEADRLRAGMTALREARAA